MAKMKYLVPKLKKGTLGVKFSDPAIKRRTKEMKKAMMHGEKHVVGQLRALQVLNKRRNPSLASKAKSDANFISGAFKGKKFVGFGKGFSKNKR